MYVNDIGNIHLYMISTCTSLHLISVAFFGTAIPISFYVLDNSLNTFFLLASTLRRMLFLKEEHHPLDYCTPKNHRKYKRFPNFKR